MKAKDIRVNPDMEVRDLIVFLQGVLYAEEFKEEEENGNSDVCDR